MSIERAAYMSIERAAYMSIERAAYMSIERAAYMSIERDGEEGRRGVQRGLTRDRRVWIGHKQGVERGSGAFRKGSKGVHRDREGWRGGTQVGKGVERSSLCG